MDRPGRSRMAHAKVSVKRKPPAKTAGAGQAEFVARLRRMVRHWPSADRLAKATGVSPSAFRKWLHGEAEPSRDRLVALAEAAGVGVAWLAAGEGAEPEFRSVPGSTRLRADPDLDGHLDPDRFLVLPKKAEAAAAGSGHPVPSAPTEFVGFRHDWLRATLGCGPGGLVLEIAAGDSMEPNICDGDLLLVDAADQTFRNFGIYVIEAWGERLVKRVQRKFDGSLVLISDNGVYQPEAISPELAKELHVVGRVIWRGGQT